MTNAELYKIGPNRECLSMGIFLYWIAYAFIQSFICFFVAIATPGTVGFTSPWGKDTGMWMEGHIAFGMAVVMANVVIAMKFHIYEKISFVCIALCTIAYWVMFAFETNFKMFT
jgi:magnesium-transporting ATPase (P-type)